MSRYDGAFVDRFLGATRGKSFRKKVSSASVTRTYPRERRQRGISTHSERRQATAQLHRVAAGSDSATRGQPDPTRPT
jgi:hypothetical protein